MIDSGKIIFPTVPGGLSEFYKLNINTHRQFSATKISGKPDPSDFKISDSQ